MVYQKSTVQHSTTGSLAVVNRGKGRLNSHFSHFNFTKSIFLILIAFSTLLLLSGSAMAATDVNTPADLQAIGTGHDGNNTGPMTGWALSDDYVLKNDITLSGVWTPIAGFTGTFDGENNTITFDNTFTFGSAPASNNGLFGTVQGVTIKNLKVDVNNAVLNVGSTSGIIIGRAQGTAGITLENCHVNFGSNGAIDGGSTNYIGGLVGLVSDGSASSAAPLTATINGCTVTGGSISGASIVGGFVGGAQRVVISNTSTLPSTVSSVNISGSNNTGGFVGFINGSTAVSATSTISNSNFTQGKISGNGNGTAGTGNYVGGLVGQHTFGSSSAVHGLTITTCSVDSSEVETVDSFVGGLVGRANGTSSVTTSNVSNSLITGSNYTGGLMGGVSTATVTNSNVSNTSVTSTMPMSTGGFSYNGGLIGRSEVWSTLTNCYFTGADVNSNSGVLGGLIGYSSGSTLQNCYSTANVTGYVRSGGLIGILNTGASNTSSLENCYSTGNVTVNGTQAVINSAPAATGVAGGLIGQISDIVNVTISKCYSTGLIKANFASAGGFVGELSGNASFSDCYSTSSVYTFDPLSGVIPAGFTSSPGGKNAGGLIGVVCDNVNQITVSLTRCYAAGSVVSAEVKQAGGLIGNTNDSTSISPTPSVHTIVKITDSYSLVSNVSAPLQAGRVIGDYDPSRAPAGSSFTNVSVWNGMQITVNDSNDSTVIGSNLKPVSRADVYKNAAGWSAFFAASITPPIWKMSVTDYGLPVFVTQNSADEPKNTNPMTNPGGNNGGGNKGPGATISNNTTNGSNNGSNNGSYTDPNNGSNNGVNDPNNDSNNGSNNGSGGRSGGVWGWLKGLFGSNGSSGDGSSGNGNGGSGSRVWWYVGVIALVVVIAGVVVYFVKFKGKDY